MPISEARRQGLLDLIAKNPEKREYILSRAGASEEDVQGTQPPKSVLSRFRSAIDTETDAMAEGVASGATWGMMDVPKNSNPSTVDLPFFGETSPSRAAGTVLGAALSPLAIPVAGVTGALASRAAPVVGEIGAQALGSTVTGASLETIRQLAFDDEIDPTKILTTAAMFLAGDMAAEYAPSIAKQLLSWKSKIPADRMALVERFKDLPEVQAEAATLKQTSPLFNPEYQAILKKQKAVQDFPKSPPFPEMPSVPPGSGVDIGAIPTAASKATQPLQPRLSAQNMAESPEVIAAARTRAELQSPSRQIAENATEELPFVGPKWSNKIKDDVETYRPIAEAKHRREVTKAMAKRQSESSMSSMQERSSDLPERVQPARKELAPGEARMVTPEKLNFSGIVTDKDKLMDNILTADLTRENARAILKHAQELEKAAKDKLKGVSTKAKAAEQPVKKVVSETKTEPGKFVDRLKSGYKTVLGDNLPGNGVRLVDVFEEVKKMPGTPKGYTLQKFADELHNLNVSGKPKGMRLSAATSTKTGKNVLTVLDKEQGKKFFYHTIGFEK